MNRLVNNASWIIACRLVQTGLSFIISMMSARYLGPSNYGLINYATSLVAFVTPFVSLGFTNILVQEFVSKPKEEGLTLGTSLLSCSVTSLVGIVGVGLFAYVFNAGERETVIVCVLYSISMIAQALEFTQYWFQAKLLSKYTAVISLTSYVIVSVYKVFLLATGKSVRWFAVSYAMDYLIIAVMLLLLYKKLGGLRLSFSFNKARSMFSRSRHYILSSLMVTIFTQTDKVMLKFMMGEAETGYYSAAIVCAGLFSFVFAAIIDSFRPEIFQNQKIGEKAFEKSIKQLYSIIIYLSLLQCITMTVFAKLIIMLTYGQAYAPAVSVLQIAVWYTTFAYLGMVRNIWILAESKQKYLWVINLSGAVANVVLNAILIPNMGINGAALASLLTQMFTNVIVGFVFKPIRPNNKLMVQSLNPAVLFDLVHKLKKEG